MTVYGIRDNVKLIREDATGKREIITLNLNNADLVLSPYYYLRQNDILYVTLIRRKPRILISVVVLPFGSVLLPYWYPLPV